MPEEVVQILAAVLIGGAIGIEREYRNRSAGFRTMVFICMGATVFAMLSSKVGADVGDPTRIAANIVSGVGFLGAGVILREGGRVAGLTTASIIWLVAALGMGIGNQLYALTGVAGVIALLVLWIFPAIEVRIDRLQENRTYTITSSLDSEKIDELKATFLQCGLRVMSHTVSKSNGALRSVWHTVGPPQGQTLAMQKLLEDEDVRAFDC